MPATIRPDGTESRVGFGEAEGAGDGYGGPDAQSGAVMHSNFEIWADDSRTELYPVEAVKDVVES